MNFPPELLIYTSQQLADALAARMLADIAAISEDVRRIGDAAEWVSTAGAGFTPFPETEAKITALLTDSASLVRAMAGEANGFFTTATRTHETLSTVGPLCKAYAARVQAARDAIDGDNQA